MDCVYINREQRTFNFIKKKTKKHKKFLKNKEKSEKSTRKYKKMGQNLSLETKITDLNKQCLIEICRHLDKHSLYNLKQTSKSFGEAIDHIVSLNDFKFNICDNKGAITEDAKIIGGFLYLFGDKIRSLRIICEKYVWLLNKHVQYMIESYCTKGNIKQLELNMLPLREAFCKRNISFLDKLDYLNLKPPISEYNDANWLLNFTASLVNLKEFYFDFHGIGDVDACDVFSALASSKLEIFDFDKHDLVLPEIDSNSLPMNFTLKKLHMRSIYNPAILTRFPNIEYLWAFRRMPEYSVEPILTLPALKKLEIICFECNEPKFLEFLNELANKNQLETYRLDLMFSKDYPKNEFETALTKILCKMTNLKEVELALPYYCSFYEHLPQIGASLANLEKFSISQSVAEEKNLNDLLKFIENLKRLGYFSCFISNNIDPLEYCEELINIRKAQKATQVLSIAGIYDTRDLTLSNEQKKYIKLIN